jgi:hypothetical protein
MSFERLVSPRGSLPRFPLDRWERAMQPVAECILGPDNAASWCLAMNNLGLIAVHRGDLTKAEKLCRSQIDRLYVEFGKVARSTPGMILALQPLVNLIRLLAPPDGREALWDAIREKPRSLDAPSEDSASELCAVLELPAGIVEAIRTALVADPQANGYIDGLIARERAQHALACRDPVLLHHAATLAAGALAEELNTVAHFWAAASANVPPGISWETRPQGHALIQLYHLIKARPANVAFDVDLMEYACRDAAKRARARLDADLLDLAFEYLEASRVAGASRDRLSSLVAEYAEAAAMLEDEVAAILAERFAVDNLSASSARLNLMLSVTGYRQVQDGPSRVPDKQQCI